MISPAGWSMRRRMALSAVIGALGASGLAPLGWWGVTLLALMAVPGLFLTAATARQAGWIGWAFGFGWFAPALVWIVEPFLVDAPRYGWMAPFALVLFSGGLALFWGLAFWLARRIGIGRGAAIVALVLTLSLAEFARAYVLTGFPWAALAQIWVGTSAARLLAFVGPHGLALLTLAVAVMSGFAAFCAQDTRARLIGLVPVLLLIVAVVTGDQWNRDETVATTGHTIRLIQPNAPQHQKWDPDFIPVFFRRSVEFTAAAPQPGQPVPDLIVWPETSVPTLLHNAGPAFDVIADAARGTPVVAGVQRVDGNRLFNTLVYLDETGRVAGTYDKHHLVPFGEYMPLGDLASRLGLRGLASRDGDGYSAGPGPGVMPLGSLGKALPLICYEAVFAQDVSATVQRPDFLLLITNDAWFGQYSGPYQHLAQAQMRAIEQGLPMIRVANTGISAMIDPLGRITHSIPLGHAGYMDAPLPVALASTIYSRTGDLPLLVILVLFTCGLAVMQTRRGTCT